MYDRSSQTIHWVELLSSEVEEVISARTLENTDR
jgi:hypothetical protein